MTFELCEGRGFDATAIADRLALVGLDATEPSALGDTLQQLVIRPNADTIIERFFDSLARIDGFDDFVSENSAAFRLRQTLRHYLLSLGLDFDQPQYFEERLRIGAVHHRLGIPQSLYQCSFQALQRLLIENVPDKLRRDAAAFDEMIGFILKIAALDMSLAVESYCAARVVGLQASLKDACGAMERFQHLAVTDWLTDLHNHSYSRQFLTEAMARAKTDNTPLCVIMADLDHFKAINDTYGHLVGDHVLRIAAARMVAGARADDEITRYGGEEFLFVLQNTDITEGKDVAERVRARFKSDVVHSEDIELTVSLSLGVAQAREGEDVDALIGRADAALYTAKLEGRDCVRIAA